MKTILFGLVECTAVGLRTSWVSFLVASLLEFIDSIDSHSSSIGVVGNWGLPCVSASDWLTDKKSWGGTIEVSTDCRNINSKYIRHKKKRERELQPKNYYQCFMHPQAKIKKHNITYVKWTSYGKRQWFLIDDIIFLKGLWIRKWPVLYIFEK
jgi:hypothetical protein